MDLLTKSILHDVNVLQSHILCQAFHFKYVLLLEKEAYFDCTVSLSVIFIKCDDPFEDTEDVSLYEDVVCASSFSQGTQGLKITHMVHVQDTLLIHIKHFSLH